MSENLRFAQTFSKLGGIPLLTSLFGCFPVEPFLESDATLNFMAIETTSIETGTTPKSQTSRSTEKIYKNVETQTDDVEEAEKIQKEVSIYKVMGIRIYFYPS